VDKRSRLSEREAQREGGLFVSVQFSVLSFQCCRFAAVLAEGHVGFSGAKSAAGCGTLAGGADDFAIDRVYSQSFFRLSLLNAIFLVFSLLCLVFGFHGLGQAGEHLCDLL
jgi:hypothetical protein